MPFLKTSIAQITRIFTAKEAEELVQEVEDTDEDEDTEEIETDLSDDEDG